MLSIKRAAPMMLGATALRVRDGRMRTTDDAYPGRDVSEELAAVVLRADQLGFCRWRVATALGISASGLAAIEQHAGLTGSDSAAGARAPR